jgi:ADP-heptose:LPS heptosyltransferase
MQKSLLFLVPARLGDALMITPALTLLRNLKPTYSIDILAASKLGAEVYANNIHCQQVYIEANISAPEFFDKYEYVVACHRKQALELGPKFQLPIIAMGAAKNDHPFAQQALNFIQSIFSSDPNPAVEKYVVFPTPADYSFADNVLPNKKLIGLHLGCHGISKKNVFLRYFGRKTHERAWPLSYFIELAGLIKIRHPEYLFVLTGGAGEELLAKQFITFYSDTINMVGKTNVLQTAALMRKLSAYICNDTGTMHLACAIKIPLIALFLSKHAVRNGPYPSSDFRKMLHAPNIRDIQPESVMDVLELLTQDMSS